MAQNEYQYDISVIIPIYNVEQFLPACLDSVVNQTMDRLEVIMIDDGSPDDSGKIADRYAKKYDNFFVYHIENGGLGHARNFAASKARGKYFVLLDSDDVVTPDCYEKMFCLAEKNNSDLATCGVSRFNSSSEWPSSLHETVFKNIKSCTHITENHDLIYDTISCNKLIRRDFWLENGFQFPENILYEDIPVTIPMHFLANNVSVVNSVGYRWRVRDMASKSITQNTGSLKNLRDRIKILQMLDKFFNEKVEDRSLHIDKQIKVLSVDLMIFIKECISVEKEQALEIMALIRSYLSEAVEKEAFDKIDFVDRFIYKCIIENDYDSLYDAVLFRVKGLRFAPVSEDGGKMIARVPQDIFNQSSADITPAILRTTPLTYINDISAGDGAITLFAQLYFPRLNISSFEEQEIKAYLCNEFNGAKTELEVTPHSNENLTSKKGVVFDRLYGGSASYNYDGTGFDIKISADALSDTGERANVIYIHYKNRLTSGVCVLRNMRPAHVDWANDLAAVSRHRRVFIKVGALLMPQIYSQSIVSSLDGFEAEEDSLSLTLDESGAELLVINEENGDDRLVTKADGKVHTIPVSQLESGASYSVFAKLDGKAGRLVRHDKTTNLIHNEKWGGILRSNKTHTISIKKFDCFTAIRRPEAEEGVFTFGTTSVGALDTERFNKAELITYDKVAGNYVTLGRANCRVGEDGRIRCSFKIDFNKESINKNLYQSRRDLLVRYLRQNDRGKITDFEIQPLYSTRHFKEVIEFETLSIGIYRAMDCSVRLNLEQLWSEEENSFDKRKALMQEHYPKFRTEPLNEKMIVFESMWGTKFSCNPRAIYEYINKHHPDYECVWVFTDERTPITGNARRVRRGSLEYYRVLAQAKYLVNNVNFEDDYVKREGQIEIQTMHGTPLKTLGLDVADEMPTIADKELFLNRVSRWNYLVVQGNFMESMAYRIYNFEREILKTGYPRTDILFESVNTNAIKEQLGIPKDKKVILYAPTWRAKNFFTMELELEKMREALSDEYVLLIRLHYFSSSGYDIPADGKFIFDLNDYAGVENLYKITDIMITDYSSVIFDFALLNKPMLFFTYDLDAYSRATRGVYFDIRTEAPGPLAYSTDELISIIKDVDAQMEKVSDRREAFIEKYLTYENPHSSKQVVKTVIRPSRVKSFVFRIKKGLQKLAPRRIYEKG